MHRSKAMVGNSASVCTHIIETMHACQIAYLKGQRGSDEHILLWLENTQTSWKACRPVMHTKGMYESFNVRLATSFESGLTLCWPSVALETPQTVCRCQGTHCCPSHTWPNNRLLPSAGADYTPKADFPPHENPPRVAFTLPAHQLWTSCGDRNCSIKPHA